MPETFNLSVFSTPWGLSVRATELAAALDLGVEILLQTPGLQSLSSAGMYQGNLEFFVQLEALELFPEITILSKP